MFCDQGKYLFFKNTCLLANVLKGQKGMFLNYSENTYFLDMELEMAYGDDQINDGPFISLIWPYYIFKHRGSEMITDQLL